MVTRIVQRAKERNALNVVEMEMTEENMRIDRFVAELQLELSSEKTNTCSTVEDQDLVRIGADFNA
jgi:hypothetical protein